MAGNALLQQGRLFVVSAPSGCGKTTLVNALLTKMPAGSLERVVTYTSRTPRPGEREGVDYCFVSHDQFTRHISEGFFLEWSDLYGHYYGTPRLILEQLSLGVSLVLIIDRAGMREVMRTFPEAISIWISPPSLHALEQRLRSRGTEEEASLQRRLQLAHQELQAVSQEPDYRYRLVNDDFERSVQELHHIVMTEADL